MCGIGGIIHLSDKRASREELLAMSPAIAHRGPDAQGVWVRGQVGLLHQRLSIIDLSEEANQPMIISADQYAIVFNGEIYNFRELTIRLQSEGVVFSTQSDTELILQAYIHWGQEKMLAEIDGMFAFGIVDVTRKKLLLARDRVGQKPLYIFQNDQKFAFASELRALLSVSGELNINLTSLDYFLSELAVPQPDSIWKEIKQLPPATALAYYWEEQREHRWKYYDLKVKKRASIISEEELLEEVQESLTKAIIKRLVSDVPIGCFLSGGIDSGLIVSLLAMHTSEPVRTFSVGFDNEAFSELEAAGFVASKFGTEHTELVLRPNIQKEVPAILQKMGEPFADSSIIPSYLICQEIGQQVKVALSGDGGDEIFGGYPEYVRAFESEVFSQKYGDTSLRKLYVQSSRVLSKMGIGKNLMLYESFQEMSGGERLFSHSGFSSDEKMKLYTGQALSALSTQTFRYLNEQWEVYRQLSQTDTMLLASIYTRMLNVYLTKVDRASMAHALEVRSPFLDRDLIELAMSIPNSMKFKEGKSKYLLRKLAEKIIHPEYASLPKKGFGLPLAQWLREDLKSWAYDSLTSRRFKERGWFHEGFIQQLLDEHMQAKHNHANKLWTLLCLENWLVDSGL